MAIVSPIEQYKIQSVLTASPGELTLMLYDGCLKYIKMAEEAIEEKNIRDANIALQKGQDIIVELMSSLDLNYVISRNLLSLYEFCNYNLADANINKNAEPLQAVTEVLVELRDAWQQALKQTRVAIYGKSEQEETTQ